MSNHPSKRRSGVPAARQGVAGLVRYVKRSAPVTGLIVVTNLLTYLMVGPGFLAPMPGSLPAEAAATTELYLLDKAARHIYDVRSFEKKVRKVADKLDIPPEWLMAIMYSESRFNPSVANHKGSGATGLIQFMPATARDFGTSTQQLSNMSPERQMDFVYKYFNRVRKTYGDFKSLSDCYLAVLYPRALNKDYCYTLYAKPSIAYRRNAGLDENKDGHVTVSDIDRRMQRIFPTAYAARLQPDGAELPELEIADREEEFFDRFEGLESNDPERAPSFLD